MPSPESDLIAAVEAFHSSDADIRVRESRIMDEVLRTSRYVRTPDFRSIETKDLELITNALDDQFLNGAVRRALGDRHLSFRLAPRLTRSGGTTTHYRSHAGVSRYEIAVATSMLFENFRDDDRDIRVCGLSCRTRLEALLRILEHELVHLVEFLCWGTSKCSAQRFQGIARRLFLHDAHVHQLVTRRERAAEAGIRVGARVTFQFEGRQMAGFVNRVNQRATVLVEDPGGLRFSDGRRYQKFYVPLKQLKLSDAT